MSTTTFGISTFKIEGPRVLIVLKFTLTIPEYEFTAFDNSLHSLWCVENYLDIDKLTFLANKLEYLYIADGHHRIAAIKKLYQIKSSQNNNHTGFEGYNYFMIAAFPKSQSKIYDYNRVIKDLNGLSENFFYHVLKRILRVNIQQPQYVQKK